MVASSRSFNDPAVPILRRLRRARRQSRDGLPKHGPTIAPAVASRRAPSPRRLSDTERARSSWIPCTARSFSRPATARSVRDVAQSRSVPRIHPHDVPRARRARRNSERRNQRRPLVHTKPSLTATAPNQVWTWGHHSSWRRQPSACSCMRTSSSICSARYVVGWMVASKECKAPGRAAICRDHRVRHGVEPGLTVHADRGSAMKSDTLAQLLATLGVERSFSRPHVSDDNAFSEAQFKTLKYQPDYPGRFLGEVHARGWLGPFFGWHNDGASPLGPRSLLHPSRCLLWARRRSLHRPPSCPRRSLPSFSTLSALPSGRPHVARPPREVSINPLTSSKAKSAVASDAAAPRCFGHEGSAPPTPPPAPRLSRARLGDRANASRDYRRLKTSPHRRVTHRRTGPLMLAVVPAPLQLPS